MLRFNERVAEGKHKERPARQPNKLSGQKTNVIVLTSYFFTLVRPMTWSIDYWKSDAF